MGSATRFSSGGPEHERHDDPAIPDLVSVHVEGEPDSEYQRAQPTDAVQDLRHGESRPRRGISADEGRVHDDHRDNGERRKDVREQ